MGFERAWSWFRDRPTWLQVAAGLLLVVAAPLVAAVIVGQSGSGSVPSAEDLVSTEGPEGASSPAPTSMRTSTGLARPREGHSARRDLVTTVTRIVDGDTLYLDDLHERMRLIGIDTPETRHPDQGVECFGHEATAHLRELVPPGTEVWVEWDVERYDRYDRPLGYLYRAEDDVFVNLQMVLDGYASSSTFPPNVAYQDEFVSAQREAREAGRGLWSACDGEADGDAGSSATEGDGESTGASGTSSPVSITTIRYDGPGNDVEYGDSEYVELANDSGRAVDVSGWSVTDEADHRIRLPSGYSIPAGGSLRIYTGPGDDSDARYYAGEDQGIWNNSGGDTATLRDAAGEVVDSYSYSS